jgi:hypothetical protein
MIFITSYRGAWLAVAVLVLATICGAVAFSYQRDMVRMHLVRDFQRAPRPNCVLSMSSSTEGSLHSNRRDPSWSSPGRYRVPISPNQKCYSLYERDSLVQASSRIWPATGLQPTSNRAATVALLPAFEEEAGQHTLLV